MLHRYQIVPCGDGDWAIIRECYMGRDWPRFWRVSWGYSGCIDVYRSRGDAEDALRLLPGVLKDIIGGGEGGK